MTINEALQRFRQEHHLTRKAVADALGIKPQSYIYEKKDVKPSAEVILKLADAFNVSADYLLGRTDKPQPPTKSTALIVGDEEIAADLIALAAKLQDRLKTHVQNNQEAKEE